ncbi:MAG TPA: lysophospholipid acyltransferase family protein [Methylophilaceae bacterium]|nr:lysophospholipid acyltransferase family protein [Methylophilaceae bacterium]
MMRLIAKILAMLPLRVTHAIGAVIGWLFHQLKPKARAMLAQNLRHSGLYPDEAEFNRAVKQNIAHTGKSLIEGFAIWGSSQQRALSWIKAVKGEAQIDEALARGKGIIFLTPHMGCFEITSIFYGSKHPITVLYRPPRKSEMEALIVQGRSKGQVKLAQTNKAGVKALLQALSKGEAVGILPDQTANKGEGEWAPVFGRPAYTMVLASKLAEKTDAAVIMAFGERLPKGQGFVIHLHRLAQGAIATPAQLNAAVEAQIRQCPLQYIWNYNRHKGVGA